MSKKRRNRLPTGQQKPGDARHSSGPSDAELTAIETHLRAARLAAAAQLTRELLQRWPDDGRLLRVLGQILSRDGRADEALDYFARVRRTGESSALLNDIGVAYRALGRTGEAEQAFRSAIKLQRNLAEAHFNLAEVKRFRTADPDLDALQSLAKRSPAGIDGIRVHFALAKAYDDLGQYSQAFEELDRANRLKRRTFKYDPSLVEALVERIIRVFSRGFWRRRRLAQALRSLGGWHSSRPSPVDRHSMQDNGPIFIVGMPRSGTTLVEQILASHELVYAVGERNELKDLVARRLVPDSEKGSALSYPDGVLDVSPKTLAALGQQYLDAVGERAPASMRIVDKTPMNFLFVGLVHLIWPTARIIHCTRHPVATCFSCYQKLFLGDQPFSYDLDELGHYHRLCTRLMRHWETVLPGVVLQVPYEELVRNTEGEIRRILDHCALPWSQKCLEFHRTERTVLTASAVQVREPIYHSSLQHWKHYRAQLAPLIEALQLEDAA